MPLGFNGSILGQSIQILAIAINANAAPITKAGV
jgi:hypothetical protein